jgi:hypothetical protein
LNGLHKTPQGPQQPETSTEIASKATMPTDLNLVFMNKLLVVIPDLMHLKSPSLKLARVPWKNERANMLAADDMGARLIAREILLTREPKPDRFDPNARC